MKDLYIENFRMLIKEIEEDTHKKNKKERFCSHIHRLKELFMWKWSLYKNNLQIQCDTNQMLNSILHRHSKKEQS